MYVLSLVWDCSGASHGPSTYVRIHTYVHTYIVYDSVSIYIGYDFEFSPALLVFGNETIHLCASVGLVNDCMEEDGEYMNFCLQTHNPVQTVAGHYSSAALVIEDNDSELESLYLVWY